MKALFIGGPADGQMKDDFDGRQFINVAKPLEFPVTPRGLRSEFGAQIVTYHREELCSAGERFFFYVIDGMPVSHAFRKLFENYHEAKEAARNEPQGMSEFRAELAVTREALSEEREFSLGALRALVDSHGSGCQCVHCIQYRAGTFKRMRSAATPEAGQ